MIRSMRIAVADDEPAMRDYYQKRLPRWGHEVTGAAGNGRELLEHCLLHRPDLVIAELRLPVLDGFEAAAALARPEPIPVILVTAAEPDPDRLVEADNVLACLLKPLNEAELGLAVALAGRRFEQFQAVRREAASLRQALEDRKIIERAKGILMKSRRLDEASAFRKLQKLARDRNHKLAEMARIIILAEDTLESLKRL
jgi:response regulator NasT